MTEDFNDIKEYAIIFMRRRKITGVRTVLCSHQHAQALVSYLQNSSKEYKDKSGKFNRVGFIECKPLQLKGE